MIRVYADDTLVYDSRREELELSSLKVTTALNLGGTAEFVLQPGHPAYHAFVGQRTIVTIYRDGQLRFRGRVLYYADNSFGQRTVTCEGEMCLLRDAISRPYLYQDTPAKIFTEVIQNYNSQVDAFKKFWVGNVTVTDSNDYVRLESESAETVLDTINKLLERCGGTLVFTDTGDGNGRMINWLSSIDRQSNQVIEFGENLLEFSSTGANTTALATGIVPYGARLEEKDADGRVTLSKKRLTIESVNGGKDYIIAADAQAVRGTILITEVWDDVTKPENLLKKARAFLNERKNFITSLELTALDLSYLAKALDSFTVGDNIRVISKYHNVDAVFQLNKMTEDLLNPAKSKITLGKDVPSLSGATVLGDAKGYHEVEALRVNYGYDVQQLASTVESSVLEKASVLYISPEGVVQLMAPLQTEVTNEKTARAEADQSLATRIANEVTARAGIINLVNGVVTIAAGAPVKMQGGKVDITGTEINMGKEVRFLNESGVRIADKDGNSYYVLRVDASNNCFVGNDYCDLYLRAKNAVYLHKTGATVTSDAREKDHIEPLSDAYLALLDKMTPVRFTYKGRDPERYHVGFTAQDVVAAMTAAGLEPNDFGGFVDLNGDGSMLGLAYDEFIGLLLHKLRKQEETLAELKTKVDRLEGNK